MKNHLLYFAFTLALMLICTEGFSQLLPPGGGNPPPDGCFVPPCVPIDGGISMLLAAGAAFGAFKLRKKENNL